MINRALFKSENHNARTPKDFFDKLNEEFHFDIDYSPHMSLIDMKKSIFECNAVYCNPPYKDQRSFIELAIAKIHLKRWKVAVFLLPARTDTKLFHELILPEAKEIRFIKGRLKFDGNKNSAPFPSMVVVF